MKNIPGGEGCIFSFLASVTRDLPRDSSPFPSYSCALFCTSLYRSKTQLFYFQAVSHSASKNALHGVREEMPIPYSRLVPSEVEGSPSPLFSRRLEAVALHVLVSHAPDGPARSGEQELLDGHTANIDSEKFGDVVKAVDEIGVQKKNDQEQDKIQSRETQCADEHRGDQVGAQNRNDNRANRKSNDAVVDGLVLVPELQRDKNHDEDNERREMPFVRHLAKPGEPLFQKDLGHNRSDASHGRGPKEILDAHSYLLVEIKERRRRPILGNEQNTSQRQGRGDQRTPANLRAVILSQKVASQPGCVEDERADEIRVVIVLHGLPPAGECPRVYATIPREVQVIYAHPGKVSGSVGALRECAGDRLIPGSQRTKARLRRTIRFSARSSAKWRPRGWRE